MKVFKLLCMIVLTALTGACTSYKKVPYLQNSETVDLSQLPKSLYDAKIMPKDLLTITVSTTDPQAAVPFNLTIPNAISLSQSNNLTSQPVLQQYLVDNDGNIDFPVLGKLHIGDMTKTDVEKMIQQKLQPYLKETPIVNVRMVNYKISVLGEVTRPGTFTVSNEKVNIFEALALAGDMTIWGQRDNVKLMREDSQGERKIVELDLNDANVIGSPYFSLQQNDVVYVTPNQKKAKNSDVGTQTSFWFSGVSILISIATLIVTLTN